MSNKANIGIFGYVLIATAFLFVAVYMLSSVFEDKMYIPGINTPGDGSISFDDDLEVNTNAFVSLEEFEEFINEYEGSSYYGLGTIGAATTGSDMVMEQSIARDEKSASQEYNDLDYSETNVQVQGIDEADLLKTDGEYIYTISHGDLYIIKAYPGDEAEIISTIDFEDSGASNIFINGDYLAVFGNFYDLDYFQEIDLTPRNGMTFFNIYDISDKENPVLHKEYKFEGKYSNGRMMGDYVYFVVNSGFGRRDTFPTPLTVIGSELREMPVSNIHYFNIPYNNPQFVSIHAINLESPSDDINSKSVAVEFNQELYMSYDNIFITYTHQINEYELMMGVMRELLEPKLTSSDRNLIKKIQDTDSDVMSQYEKDAKIMQIYYRYLEFMSRDEQDALQDEAKKITKEKVEEFDYLEYTIINKIAVKNGNINVEDNGKVPGHIMNQFSMDEDQNVFRIATTVSNRWSQYTDKWKQTTNNIYALDENMEIMGKLEGLAESESIYSTRFIGDKLYMVTFKQVDPFFVIDLSNPRNIKELGQLKIPGFSRYMHPYDEDTIIGIGQDATETGRTTGLKISLFDVSDFENPKEIAKFVTEERYAGSTALYEHKAFLFSKQKNLLVIPAYSGYAWRWEEGKEEQETYNGAFVFDIKKDEIKLRGLIDHSMASKDEYYYGASVQRSLYIENNLYTKSESLLRINELDDLSSIKNIEIERESKIPVY